MSEVAKYMENPKDDESLRFDPETGKLQVCTESLRFNPITGKLEVSVADPDKTVR